jgi:ribosome-binding protein aMBF1 (putative translation factor)
MAVERPKKEAPKAKEPIVEPVVEEVVETPVAEPVAEVAEAKAEEVETEAAEPEVEVMSKRGRKSAAEKAAEIQRTREDIESNFANMIAHEPAKADLFRLELAQALKDAGLA